MRSSSRRVELQPDTSASVASVKTELPSEDNAVTELEQAAQLIASPAWRDDSTHADADDRVTELLEPVAALDAIDDIIAALQSAPSAVNTVIENRLGLILQSMLIAELEEMLTDAGLLIEVDATEAELLGEAAH